MSKTCQKLDLKNSWNWGTVLIPAWILPLFSVKLIRGKWKYMSIWWNLLGKTREITLMELILWQLLAIGTTVRGTRLLLLHFFQHKWILSGQPTDMPKKPTLSRFGDVFPLSDYPLSMFSSHICIHFVLSFNYWHFPRYIFAKVPHCTCFWCVSVCDCVDFVLRKIHPWPGRLA